MINELRKVDEVKASIGMPVYNAEKYIKVALELILSQTFSNFELIISDNASNDATEAICREYASKDLRIRYIRQTENRGPENNFHFVLEEARNEYFMWTSHDDLWTKDYLESAISMLQSDKTIDFIFPIFELRSIRLRICKKFDKEIFKFVDSSVRKTRVLSFLALHHNSHKCNIVHSVFRSEFLKKVSVVQRIGNDGALGGVILSLGRGKVSKAGLFSKRYSTFWPGALNSLHYMLYGTQSSEFELAKEIGFNRLYLLFPEYTEDIKMIFNNYQPYSHKKNYQICSVVSSCRERDSESR